MESFASKLGVPEHEFRVVIGRTRIEYDADKDKRNRKKHGYALESAVYLFEACFAFFSPRRIITSDAFIEKGEVRHMHLAEDTDGTLMKIVTTMRPGEVIRVLSLRKANRKEVAEFKRVLTRGYVLAEGA